jgi:Zn-dependent peptidase ImmA (M78 family)
METRYRTTLTHEYGHVHFHGYLFAMEPRSSDLFQTAEVSGGGVQVCKRDTILDARKTDWMEWQAGYVCGALLMPISLLHGAIRVFQEERNLFGPIASGSTEAAALIQLIRTTFHVSAEAARIRLLKLDFLAAQDHGTSFFASAGSVGQPR